MAYAKHAAAAALLTLALGATSASAADVANVNSCMKASEKVRDALNSNQQSPQYQNAMTEFHAGRDFCANGLYAQGIARYDNALKMLGAAS